MRGGKEYSPRTCASVQYVQKVQYLDPLDTSEYLSDKETNFVQQVYGTFLYYAIAIDNNILPTLSNISSDQSKATTNTSKQVAKLLKYLASNPQAEIQYRASGVQLAIHSDASYLSVAQDRSRSSGVHFISKDPPDPENPEDFVPTINGILLVMCKIMRNIMASAAEAKYGIIFVNAQTAVPIHTNLSEMGCKQGPTTIQVENSIAVGIATKEFRQKKSKAMDMRFYWINDRIKQGKFRVFWIPVPENLGDYHSKHHPPEHHIAVRSKYLHVPNLRSLQGCVNLTVRVDPTKRESQRAKLERYFLEFVS